MKSKLPTTLTLSQLTRLLEISRQAVAEHVKVGTIVKTGRGAYSLASVPRYIASLRKIASASGGSSPQRERLLRARARRAELEVAKLEGKLVPADQVEVVWTRELGMIQRYFLAIPSKAADQLAMARTAPECFAIVMRYCRDALTAASEAKFEVDDDDDDAEAA